MKVRTNSGSANHKVNKVHLFIHRTFGTLFFRISFKILIIKLQKKGQTETYSKFIKNKLIFCSNIRKVIKLLLEQNQFTISYSNLKMVQLLSQKLNLLLGCSLS